MVTVFGGIGYKKSEWGGWGYSGAENDEDFLSRSSQGCYLPDVCIFYRARVLLYQLTEVEQEINGLLTYDRLPKVSVDGIKKIVTGQSY